MGVSGLGDVAYWALAIWIFFFFFLGHQDYLTGATNRRRPVGQGGAATGQHR